MYGLDATVQPCPYKGIAQEYCIAGTHSFTPISTGSRKFTCTSLGGHWCGPQSTHTTRSTAYHKPHKSGNTI